MSEENTDKKELEKANETIKKMGEELERLKNHADKVLSEKKESDKKKREAEEEKERLIVEDAKKKGDHEQLLKSSEEERERLKAELATIKQQTVESKLSEYAMKQALEFTKDTSRAEMLAKEFKSRLRIDGDDIKVTDEKGNLTISPVEDMTKSVAERYPFLVDGKGASGGGAAGNNGGSGGAVPKLSELNDSDLTALKNDNLEMFKRVISENK